MRKEITIGHMFLLFMNGQQWGRFCTDFYIKVNLAGHGVMVTHNFHSFLNTALTPKKVSGCKITEETKHMFIMKMMMMHPAEQGALSLLGCASQ